MGGLQEGEPTRRRCVLRRVIYKYIWIIFIEIKENEGQIGLWHVSVEVYKGYVKMMEVQFQKAAWF